MSTLSELGGYLQDHALGIQGESLFLGSMPDTPDEVVSLYIYHSGPPEYVQNSYNPNQEFVQLQVVARATRYERAEVLASKAWVLLAPITNAVIGGTKYRSIRPSGSPSTMGRDTNDRPKVFFNATIEKEVSLVS